MSEDLELLIINQIMLQNHVKRLLNNENSEVDKVVENLNDLNQNTNDLTAKLLGEPTSLTTSGPSVDTPHYDFYVDLVDQSLALQAGLYLRQRNGELTEVGRNWENSTNNQKLFYIINRSTDTIIKDTHIVLLGKCKDENKELPSEFVEFLQFMLDLRNLNFAPEDQAHLYFPEIGMRFERSEMIATEEVMNGDVIKVLMPGIPKLKMKALVVVRT